MSRRLPIFLALITFGLFVASGAGQEKKTPPPLVPPGKVEPVTLTKPTPPAATLVAATVNGEKITELQLFRALLRENPKNRETARKELMRYLVDNLLIDQYLRQMKVQVEAKEVDERVQQIKDELKKAGQEYAKQLEELFLTEEELRKEIASALRWDKFVAQQGTDKVLQELFDKNKVMFDGTQVQARHILISTKETPVDKAKAQLEAIKKRIEDQVNAHLAKLPPGTDKLTVEKQRIEAIEKAFADAAAKESGCPSKEQGGDLGWFPRVGEMVEPFARTAFSLKAYQMSDPVLTDFGYHLILTTDWKMGKEVKFADVRPHVVEVYAERLRDAVINAYTPRSKVEIHKGG